MTTLTDDSTLIATTMLNQYPEGDGFRAETTILLQTDDGEHAWFINPEAIGPLLAGFNVTLPHARKGSPIEKAGEDDIAKVMETKS